jgi:hypothetical protein
METAKQIDGIKLGYAEVVLAGMENEQYTQVYDEDGDRLFSLRGEHSAETINTIIGIYRQAFENGAKIGEFRMANKLRALIGAAASA